MVGNGGGGSGGWLRLKGWHRWLAGFMLRQLGVPASALDGNLEAIYAAHLVELVRDSSMDAIVLLAHERVHDPDGTPRDDLGSMFVPNDESKQTEQPKEKTFESNANSIAASQGPATGTLPLPSQDGKERPNFDLDTHPYSLPNDGAQPQPSPTPEP